MATVRAPLLTPIAVDPVSPAYESNSTAGDAGAVRDSLFRQHMRRAERSAPVDRQEPRESNDRKPDAGDVTPPASAGGSKPEAKKPEDSPKPDDADAKAAAVDESKEDETQETVDAEAIAAVEVTVDPNAAVVVPQVATPVVDEKATAETTPDTVTVAEVLPAAKPATEQPAINIAVPEATPATTEGSPATELPEPQTVASEAPAAVAEVAEPTIAPHLQNTTTTTEVAKAEPATPTTPSAAPTVKAAAPATVEATAQSTKTSDEPEGSEETEPEKSATPPDVAMQTTSATTTRAAAAPQFAVPTTFAADKHERSTEEATHETAPVDGNAKSAAPEIKPTSDRPAVDVQPRTNTAASSTSTGSASSATSESSLTQAERTRLVQRVARAMHTAHDRGGELRLRLSPPELGSLRLHVELHDGVMSARIEAETREAQQVISENLIVLRDRLAEQNIRIERFDVDLFNSGRQGGGQAPQGGYDGRQNFFGRSTTGDDRRTSLGADSTATERRTDSSFGGDGALNVIV